MIFVWGARYLIGKVSSRRFIWEAQSKPSAIIKNIDLEKPSLRPSKSSWKLKTTKNSKLLKLSENCFEPVGKGGWPPISTWINPISLQRNGLHCVEFLGEREKHLLNLHLDELLALLDKLHYLAC
jgi:hypothetical protein